MRRRRNSGFWWIFFFMIMFGGIMDILPLVIIMGIIVAIAMSAVKSSNEQEKRREENYERAYSRTESYYRPGRQQLTAAQMAKINVYLRKWFHDNRSLPLDHGINLRVRGQKYASLASLDVYQQDRYVGSLNDFGRNYPDSYNEIQSVLCRLAERGQAPAPINVEPIEAEVVEARPAQESKWTTINQPQAKPAQPKMEEPSPAKKEEPKKSGSREFMETINDLNNNIKDEGITNSLYETVALLKQINNLEQRFPDSKDKLKKLYDYYLPILVRILQQYENLQAAQTDPSYEETKKKLSRTIVLINDAMKTIISSLTDQDFINLAADISTLEAVLQKDGLTNEGKIMQTRGN